MNTSQLKTVSILAAMIFSIPSIGQADNSASAYNDVSQSTVIGAAAATAGVMDDDGWTNVLSSTLSNSGAPKDLIIGLTYETMLMTETVVKSKGGDKSSAIADAEIEMYVTVDGKVAAPGVVTFDRRTQELWAKLGGVLDCEDINGDGIVSFDECLITDEEIGLILDTKSAHGFNFLSYNIGSGSHVIKAFARLSIDDTQVLNNGEANASASLGKGTLSVWEVHGSMSTN